MPLSIVAPQTSPVPPSTQPVPQKISTTKRGESVYIEPLEHPDYSLADLSKRYHNYYMIENVPGLENTYMKFRFPHTVSLEKSYRLALDGTISNVRYTIHLDHNNFFEKTGKLRILDKELHPTNGTYRRLLEVNGIIKAELNTFFPSHWTPDDLIAKIIEVFKSDYVSKPSGKDILVEGCTNCGIKIRIIIKPNGIITTVFPLWENVTWPPKLL